MTPAESEHPRNAELHRHWRAGDASARDRLIEGNMWAVEQSAARIAGRRGWPGLSRDDMAQAGVIGLIGAIGRWEPARGCYLPVFARRRVRTAIMEAVGRSATVVVTPRFCRRARSQWAALTRGAQMIEAQGRRVEPVGRDDPIFDRESGPAEAIEARDSVDAMLRPLRPDQSRCLRLYLGLDDGVSRTYSEVASMFGRGEMWAWNRCREGIETLRRQLGGDRESA